MRTALALLTFALACGAEPETVPVAAAPVVVPSGPPTVAPSPAVPPRMEPELRVATYNILAGNHGLDEVIDALRSFDADLIALQEVDHRTRRSGRVDQPATIAKALGMDVAFAHHRTYDGGRIGVALLSRYAIANARRVALPVPGLAALDAEVELAGELVQVLVVHLHPTDPRDPAAARIAMDAKRLREARAVLEIVARSDRPTIVLGDFNARPSGPEYRTFAAMLRDACPDGGATWPAALPLVRIDYVWTSAELQSLGCPQFFPSASDHRPVVVDLARRG